MKTLCRKEVIGNKLSDLKPGELVFLGGRPATGKTTTAIALAEYYAQQFPPRHSMFFTYEMPRNTLEDLLNKDAAPSIHINNTLPKLNGLESLMRDMTARHHAHLAIIDYLQLIREEPTDVLNTLKTLAVELNIAIVIVGQLLWKKQESAAPTNNQIHHQEAVECTADRIVLLRTVSPPRPRDCETNQARRSFHPS